MTLFINRNKTEQSERFPCAGQLLQSLVHVARGAVFSLNIAESLIGFALYKFLVG